MLCLYQRQASLWGSVTCLGLAMTGGGFWSSQELNWGGWWNWDVLEMGSLFVWSVIVASAHVGPGSPASRVFAGLTTIAALTFYLLNKTGIGVSIHSFVTSDVVRTNYIACTALAGVVLIGQVKPNVCAATLCCTAYSGATSFEALKLPATTAVFLRMPPWGWQSGLHTAGRAAACAAAAFNYFNTLFTGPCGRHPGTLLVSSGPRASVSAEGYKLVHLKGWRSKPISTAGPCLGSVSTRSSSGASKWVAYAK